MMKRVRLSLAVIAAKLLIRVGKLAGKKGSSTPGGIALKICPSLIEDLSIQVKKEIIVACGTNGKTTTNNMLADMLEYQGYNVVCNRVGANMINGVATAFCLSSNISGKLVADYACIEIDEASSVKVFDFMNPNILVITNLFRDQLDRYGEIDITIDYLNRAIAKTKDTILLLNGDDPLTAQFGKKYSGRSYFYGLDLDKKNTKTALEEETKEGRYCLICGEILEYEEYYFSQLGIYKCTCCDFKRPDMYGLANKVVLDPSIAFKLNIEGKSSIGIDTSYIGLYNIYNMLASSLALDLLALPLDNLNKVFQSFKPQIGRMEQFNFDKPVILNLSKNPAGFNQAIDTVLSDPRDKDLLVIINDNYQDGIDISWLWDVDFHNLKDPSIKNISISGIRRNDLEVRFKYAGEESILVHIYDDFKVPLEEITKSKTEVSYVLVNYTALFDTQDEIKSLHKNYKEDL